MFGSFSDIKQTFHSQPSSDQNMMPNYGILITKMLSPVSARLSHENEN